MSRKSMSPSDRRHEARRAIRLELKARDEYWKAGGRSQFAVRMSDLRLTDLYEELRAAGGDPGDPYWGPTTASFTQPPNRAVVSMPGKWPASSAAGSR